MDKKLTLSLNQKIKTWFDMNLVLRALGFILFVLSSNSVLAQSKGISEAKFVKIGGVDQWVTISGNDLSKPVILFVHGGPGSVMTPYAKNIYGDWEKDFILVNWDQRGAGRTYGRNAPPGATEEYWIENPLTVEQITGDAIELTEYLINYLDKEKVVIMATSWGSIPGTLMALKRPELFYAYVGHSQIVNFSANLEYAYQKVSSLAKKEADQETVENLQTIGEPPYENAQYSGQLIRVIKKYERNLEDPAPASWWKIATAYDNETDNENRYAGDDYSFVNFVGHKKMGIKSMVAGIDFNQGGLEFEVPVYLIQGEEDILTSGDITKPYFDKIKAPEKMFFLLPGAAHGHNQSVVDQQYLILKNYIFDPGNQ